MGRRSKYSTSSIRSAARVQETPPGPLPWEFVTKSGVKVTPKTAQQYLVHEVQRGASRAAMIRFLHVGEEALDVFFDNAVTIPSSVGEKIVWLIDNSYQIRHKSLQDLQNEYVSRKVRLAMIAKTNNDIRKQFGVQR